MSMKRGRSLALLVACVWLSLAAFGTGLAAAQKGKTVALQESAALKIIKNEGSLHEATGRATGTVKGAVHLTLNVEDASHITGRYSTNGPDGGLIGTVVAKYTVSGSVLRFTGTSTITGGAGPYASAHGRGVHIAGVMNRLKGTMSVKLDGTIRT